MKITIKCLYFIEITVYEIGNPSVAFLYVFKYKWTLNIP